MSNHIHLIASARDHNLSDVLRDFKKFTSKRILNAIMENKQESRKEWMLAIFRRAGQTNIRNECYQFWRQDNQPKEVYSPGFVFQKLEYVNKNPVEAGLGPGRRTICIPVPKIIIAPGNVACWIWCFYKLTGYFGLESQIRSCKLRTAVLEICFKRVLPG